MNGPNSFKRGFEDSLFFHISTDEVYGTLTTDSQSSFTENSNYAPNSPYAASKASAETVVRSFFRTYGLKTLITSCSNNYGERQNKEKLIPHIINSILSNQNIQIHGNGRNIRDWLYVGDHCDAIYSLLKYKHTKYGEKYNIGGGEELENIEVVKLVCEAFDAKVPSKVHQSYKELISFVKDRPGNDLRYSVDASKIKSLIGWEPKTKFVKGLDKMVDWYISENGIKV
jgi:dTDP-glucose 4,6-dehydratase